MQNNGNLFKTMGLVTVVSSQIAGSILIGIFIGMKLDQWLDLSPLFLIIFLLLGLATGVYGMLKTIKKYTGEKDDV